MFPLLSSICFVILFRVSYYAWVYCQPKKRKYGEGKRRNEFAEWPVAWLAKWHNYVECNICRMTQRNFKITLKSAPFFGANQSANAAAVLMLTYDDNQKATKAHCRLAFSAQPQRFFLPLLVGLHGSTDTTARKSAIIEEKMFWKVTLPSTSAKRFSRLTYLYLYLQPGEKCFFFKRWITWSWHNIQRWNGFLFLPILFFPHPTALAFFHDQTHSLTQTRKVRRHAKGRKKTESSSLHSISGLQINVWLGASNSLKKDLIRPPH